MRKRHKIVWVHGEDMAKKYPIKPNSTLVMLDSYNTRVYIKTADFSGKPALKTYEYRELK